MSADWPSTGTLMHPYTLTPGEVTRTQMESGPPKQTNADGLVLESYSVTYHFEKADYQAWRAWFHGTDVRASGWFNWPNPDTDTTVRARVQGGKYRAVPTSSTQACYRVSMTIECFSTAPL